MGLRVTLIYGIYERRLQRSLGDSPRPRHVGVILDGNRRWARAAGASDVSQGHRAGADHIIDLLAWCTEAGVEVVTLWLLSSDNLSRPDEELLPLLDIIEATVTDLAAADEPWRVHPVGSLDLLRDSTVRALKEADEVNPRQDRAAGQRRDRLRRTARDRRCRTQLAAGARVARRVARGGGERARRRAHR